MFEYEFFILGIIVGIVLGSIVYEFFTFKIIRVIFKKHGGNNE